MGGPASKYNLLLSGNGEWGPDSERHFVRALNLCSSVLQPRAEWGGGGGTNRKATPWRGMLEPKREPR